MWRSAFDPVATTTENFSVVVEEHGSYTSLSLWTSSIQVQIPPTMKNRVHSTDAIDVRQDDDEHDGEDERVPVDPSSHIGLTCDTIHR